ncbi:protein TIFY 3-like isoform X1 [Musa acuminata AAA Group]|uniref:protein TIFY 3-like isoform X1 n=1 Tax=Musa acuminata AAA Group TaxID=214697 RepID=UPI0031D696F6
MDHFDARIEAERKEMEKNSAGHSLRMPMAKLTTMFHGRRVRAYNAIPRDKQARAILLIAAAATKTPAIVGPSAATAAALLGPLLTRSLSLQSSTAGEPPQVELQAELPMARRKSLQRFLEKRQNRLVSAAPYASAKSLDMEGDSERRPQLNSASLLAMTAKSTGN